MGLLNDLQVKAAEPRDKEYLLSDGEGLYLRVRAAGKAWLYRFQQDGKPGKLGLGTYPTISLAGARKKPERRRSDWRVASIRARCAGRSWSARESRS